MLPVNTQQQKNELIILKRGFTTVSPIQPKPTALEYRRFHAQNITCSRSAQQRTAD